MSKVVNLAINTPPLYALMKVAAKQAMRGTVESRGGSWAQHVESLRNDAEVYAVREELEDKSLAYPDYYLKPFHAYDRGNLDWLAAFEVEPASYAMALRTFKTETSLTPQEAMARLRGGISDAMAAYFAQQGVGAPSSLLDIGCSVGVSTRWLAAAFPSAQITGLDLSPHFLAVAELSERRNPTTPHRIRYLHRLAEQTGLPGDSWDVVTHQFVIHECPPAAITAFIQEAARLLRPGGALVMVDNDPRSKTIQNLPPVLATLMKSTEPWSDVYYAFDVEGAMAAAGLRNVTTVAVDHRHRAVMAVK